MECVGFADAGSGRVFIFAENECDMQKVNIPILGLTSNSEARAVVDGECMVLHNLTVEEGGVKVIAPPTESAGVESVAKKYYHEKAKEWLTLYNSGSVASSKGTINQDGKVKSLSFVGNIVVMYCADGVRYAIYDGGYRYMGKLPELPRLNVAIESKFINIQTDNWYYKDGTEVAEKDVPLIWSNASKGYFDQCMAGLYQQGAFVDRTMVRLAARMFDGSYVAFSPIYYVEDKDELLNLNGSVEGFPSIEATIGRDNKNFVAIPASTADKSKFYTSVRGFVPTFSLEQEDLSKWRDVIVGIDLFAVPSIMGHRTTSEIEVTDAKLKSRKQNGRYGVLLLNEVGDVRYERYVVREGSEIEEEIANASQYYKIAEYDLKGNEVWRLKNTSPSQMAVQKALPVEECPHELMADYRYLYNNKVHLAGLKEYLRDAFNHYSCLGMEDEDLVQITSVVTLVVDGKEQRVISNVMAPKVGKKDEKYFLAPILAYPDARATKMKVYVGYNTGVGESQSVVKYKEFPLKAHNTLNLAYYMDGVATNKDGITGLNPIALDGFASLGSDEVAYKESGGKLTGFTVKDTESRTAERLGVMRVSEVDNPIYYPARFTYSFDAEIVAVCSNVIALSQGQFGQHPLYVFTKSGVWAMTVDAAGGSYLSQVPASREVCSNGAGVSSTIKGVVFPANKALMLMNGADAVDISASLAGLETTELRVKYDVIERICGVVGKGHMAERVSFTDYLNGAFTAYDYNTGLLYVCNSGYDYSYVYNMNTGAWSTADGQYAEYVPYPGKMVLSGKVEGAYKLYTFDRYNKTAFEQTPIVMPVAMVTRGCIFGSTGLKRVGECALRVTMITDKAGFYVLGSVDGVKWELVGGREAKDGVRAAEPTYMVIRDLVTRFNVSRSYRFISFAFVGNVRNDAKLLMCEATTTEAWSNRVR